MAVPAVDCEPVSLPKSLIQDAHALRPQGGAEGCYVGPQPRARPPYAVISRSRQRWIAESTVSTSVVETFAIQ